MMLAKYGSKTAEYRRVEAAYVVHKSTWDEKGMSRATLNDAPLIRPGSNKVLAGLPDVYRYRGINGNKESEFIDLTQDRQHWLLHQNITRYKRVQWTKAEYFAWFNSASPEVNWAARQLTGALTRDRSHSNFLGMDNCKNYLTGEIDRDGLPKMMKILTGWARLRLYEDGREIWNIAGVGRCIAFHAINASLDLWSVNWWTSPWLFDRPCITGREVRFDAKGSPYIHRDDLHYPYEFFGGSLIFPIWLPNTDKGFVLETLTRAPKAGEVGWKFE